MKHRLQRVNEVLRRELGDLLAREFTFKAKLVTVQQVDVTPDLKHAHVFVSIIGTDEESKAVMASLHDSRPQLQHSLSRRVVLKYTPHLHFKIDDTIERGTRVISILQDLGVHAEDPEEPVEDDR